MNLANPILINEKYTYKYVYMYIGSSGLCKLELIALQCDVSDMSECIVAPDVETFQFVDPRYVLGWKIISCNMFLTIIIYYQYYQYEYYIFFYYILY